MKFLVVTALLILSGAAFSADCSFKVNKRDIKLEWTAYKTPAKAGVKGSFKDYGLEKDMLVSKTVSGLLGGVKFAIKTPTVATKDAQRDQKIAKFFFNNVKTIKGSILEADESSMVVGLNMNGVKKEVPMTVSIDESRISAKGTIDVMDFAMGEHLAAINKACFDLHQGKTWSDVALALTVKFEKVCK